MHELIGDHSTYHRTSTTRKMFRESMYCG